MFSKFKKTTHTNDVNFPPKEIQPAQQQAPTQQPMAPLTQPEFAPQPILRQPAFIPDDLSQIIQGLLQPVMEAILNHPLFISSLASELEKRRQLENAVVQSCFAAFEAKYDITPTQVYREKITAAYNTLDTINNQVKEQTESFEELKTFVVDFQKDSVKAYMEAMEQITQRMLNKIKL